MSISTSRFPASDMQLGTPVYSPPKSNNRGQDSPIKKYMRINNNFYLQLQQDAKQKEQSNASTTYELKNLKQFQRQLEQQPVYRNQTRTNNFTPKKNSERIIYSNVTKQEIQETQKQEPDVVFEHRAKQTRQNGQRVIEKIKSFILNEKPLVSPKSPRRKKHPDLYANISSSIEKLHKQSQRKDIARREIYIKKFTGEQVKQIKPFKVDNPVSLYLIDKRNQSQGGHKPLYERALDIAREKQQAQFQMQLAKQQQNLIKQQQEFIKFQQMKKQKYPDSATKEKQQKFYHDLQMKQKLKNLAKQQQKILHLQQMTKQKPYINKTSKEMFNKKIQRDQLSRNFVQRIQEYKFQRQKQKLKETQRYDAQYCPFAPKISQASRDLAQKYHQRKKHQQEIAKKKALDQKQLNKKLQQMNKNANRSRSPSLQKYNSHKRSNSTNVLRNKQKSKLIANQNNIPSKEDEIPIYNRYIPDKRRPLSCVNVGCRKL